jgi:hypothetical protein
MSIPLLKQPSAFLPILISLTALAMILGYVTLDGVTRQHDEAAPARIFQLLMVAQIPIVLFFAMHWLPQAPKQALLVLGLQAAAWIVPVATILFLEN